MNTSSETSEKPPSDFGYQKLYVGIRTRHGCRVMVVEVLSSAPFTIRERPLRPRRKHKGHIPSGYEWGYGGSGPAQLALALAADVCQDVVSALRIHQQLKWSVVSRLQGDAWILRHEDLLAECDRLIQIDRRPGGIYHRTND